NPAGDHGWVRSLAIATSVMVGIGCSGPKVTSQTSNELPRYQIHTIALMPFTTLSTPQVREVSDMYLSTPESVKGSDISLGMPSSFETQLKQTTTVPTFAAEKVTQLFWTRLKNRPGIVVVSPTTTAAKIAAHPKEELVKLTPERQAADVAAELKADAALMGQVLVYQERSGGKLGANPPATVGFEVKAVAVDGQVLWVGNYYERQKPLTQDFLGFIQHGGVFVTAEELAQYGADQVLKRFPFGSDKGD
ncbi:MAG TPA: hypothetical protein VFL19_03545, partial [Nitrospira sp.]|nr:hypothetical protein [Nitrospira sp.]